MSNPPYASFLPIARRADATYSTCSFDNMTNETVVFPIFIVLSVAFAEAPAFHVTRTGSQKDSLL